MDIIYRLFISLLALVTIGCFVYVLEYQREEKFYSFPPAETSSKIYARNIQTNETNIVNKVSKISSFQLEKNPEMYNIDCDGIMKGKDEAIAFAQKELKKIYSERNNTARKKLIFSDKTVSSWANNCSRFVTKRKYITSSLTQEEKEYPIAYSISIYANLQSFEQLLREIYQPQNIYCVHVDQKSLAEFQTRVVNIIKCFDNVFLASKMTKVWYTQWTIVQASLNCMEDLVKRKVEYNWKYVINLCGLDYPTKTNLEFVRSLKNLGGYNSVASRSLDIHEKKYNRTQYVYKHPMKICEDHQAMKKTTEMKESAPHNIKVFTGSDHFVFSREAVIFMLNDPKIKAFFEWSKDTLIPDETVWATLVRMYPQFPGSLPIDKGYDTYTGNGIARIKVWEDKKNPCGGKYVRSICVFGVSDLKWLVAQKQLFANKMNQVVDVFAVNCLAEWLRNKTIDMALKML